MKFVAHHRNNDIATLTEKRRGRGQAMVEMAILLPLLMLILAVVTEGTLAYNAWIRVNTAARDGARFALDKSRPDDISALVIRKLDGMDTSELNIYLITGNTDDSGRITTWDTSHLYGGGDDTPGVSQAAIEERLQSQGSQPSYDVPFVIVEVDYVYNPVALGLFLGRLNIPMSSYDLIHQY
jgi:hypothetical protein